MHDELPNEQILGDPMNNRGERVDSAVNVVTATMLASSWLFVIAHIIVRVRSHTKESDDFLMFISTVRRHPVHAY